MKNQKLTSVLFSFGGLVLLGGLFGVLAQQEFKIDTDAFSAIQKIKTTFFVEKNVEGLDTYQRVKVEHNALEGGVMNVGLCTSADCDQERLKNEVVKGGSALGGRGNKNQIISSLVVGGKNNTLSAGTNSLIGGSDNVSMNGGNAVALGSRDTQINNSNAIAVGVQESTLLGSNVVALGVSEATVSQNNVFVIGKDIAVNNQGVFAFNAKNQKLTAEKDHTFLINADRGLIINTDTPASDARVALTIKGTLKPGYETKSSDKSGSLINKTCKSGGEIYSCVCAYGQETAPKSVSSAPVCEKVCETSFTNNANCPTISPVCGAKAGEFPAAAVIWPHDAKYCDIGSPSVMPKFPGVGETVTWNCLGTSGASKECTATRLEKSDPVIPTPTPINGQCSTQLNTCTSGTFVDIADSSTHYLWRCEGIDGGINAPICQRAIPQNAQCSSSYHNTNQSTLSASPALCTVGTVANFKTNSDPLVYTQKWTWDCVGETSYVDSCFAHKPAPNAGVCNTDTLFKCKVPTSKQEDGINQTTITGGATWNCEGTNGGATVACNACYSNYTWNNATKTCDPIGQLCSTAPDITIGDFTIQACNLGATVVGLGTNSYGNYFQRGNNHPFPNDGMINTTSTRVNTTGYGPGNYFLRNLFVNVGPDWSTSRNDGLRGGNVLEDLDFIPIGIEAINRQGPCPADYHVPTAGERNQLLKTWVEINPVYSGYFGNSGNPSYYGYGLGRYNGGHSFNADISLSSAGYFRYSTMLPEGKNGYYFYGTSTPVDTNKVAVFAMGSAQVGVARDGVYTRSDAYPIRCFKNRTVAPVYECTGPVPANATLVGGDDQGLTANTARKLVASNTSAKCEYVCNSGYSYDSTSNSCVAIPQKPQCGTQKNTCTIGTLTYSDSYDWGTNTRTCAEGSKTESCISCDPGYQKESSYRCVPIPTDARCFNYETLPTDSNAVRITRYLTSYSVGTTTYSCPNNIIIPSKLGPFPGKTVKVIGSWSFDNGGGGSWFFPYPVDDYTSIGGLKSLWIPDSVVEIEDNAIRDNPGLTTIIFDDNNSSLKKIGDRGLFNNCITSIKLPHSLEEIGESAFVQSNLDPACSMTSVTFNQYLKYIGDNAFNKQKLTSLSFVSVPYEIGKNAFSYNNISTISRGSAFGINRVIKEYAFAGNALTEIEIPYGISLIERNAFMNNNLTKMNTRSSLVEIGDGAFRDNPISSLPWGGNEVKNLTKIGNYAYYGNSLPKKVFMLDSIKNIGASAFCAPGQTNSDRVYGFFNNHIDLSTITNSPSSCMTIKHMSEYNYY